MSDRGQARRRVARRYRPPLEGSIAIDRRFAVSAVAWLLVVVVLVIVFVLVGLYLRRRRRGGGVIATRRKQ